jgi:hypothetical protein
MYINLYEIYEVMQTNYLKINQEDIKINDINSINSITRYFNMVSVYKILKIIYGKIK